MTFNRKQQWIIFSVVNVLLLLVIILFPIYYKYVMPLPKNDCLAVTFLGIYCPGCGCTRAMKAVFDLDLPAAFSYNPIIPIGIGFFIYYEVSMIVHLIRRTDRDPMHNVWVLLVFFGIWFIYAVLRNLLLLFGIDTLGAIL